MNDDDNQNRGAHNGHQIGEVGDDLLYALGNRVHDRMVLHHSQLLHNLKRMIINETLILAYFVVKTRCLKDQFMKRLL